MLVMMPHIDFSFEMHAIHKEKTLKIMNKNVVVFFISDLTIVLIHLKVFINLNKFLKTNINRCFPMKDLFVKKDNGE